MIESIHSSMFFIIQRSYLNHNDHDKQIWTPYIDRQDPDMSLIHVRPFQHNAQFIDCINKKDFTKLYHRLKQKYSVLIKSIRSNIWYGCHKYDMDQQVHEYMLRTKAYVKIENLNQPHHEDKVRQLLDRIVDEIQCLLKNFNDHQLITSFQYQQMNVQRSTSRLHYMFFMPDTSQQEQIIFEPRIISILSPLMPICRYLYRLLAPLYYNQVGRRTTIFKGADLVSTLELYQQQNYLQSTTYFITISVKDPYTSMKHTRLLQSLKCFLDDFILNETLEGMNIMAIIKLTEFLLDHQYFIYENSIYHQILGGSNTLYFLDLLIDIYLFYWQQPLVSYQNEHDIFVRCFNHLFLTWNDSKDRLNEILQKMTDNDSSMQCDINFQRQDIKYLDVQIHYYNEKRLLQTQVYHDWKYEPYIIPTMYDSSSFPTLNLIQMALLRAVLCCSQVEDFEQEQQYIEYSFLFNRYSFHFIRRSIEQFFNVFKVLDLNIYHDQATYDEFRRNVRQYNEENTEEKIKLREKKQKQCIWYIYSKLKGLDFIKAQENPKELLPPYICHSANSNEISIELVLTPEYPSNTL